MRSAKARLKKSKLSKSKPVKAQGEHCQTAQLFQNGHSQAVRLPKEFRMPGNTVYVKKMDNCVLLIPVDNPWWPLLNTLGKFPKDFFPNGRELLPDQEREDIFP